MPENNLAWSVMKIWVDGDACPKAIKTILFNAAKRTKTLLCIVSNHYFDIPPSPFITRKIVESGFDVVDHYIVEHIEEKDLLITADIPLADAALTKNAAALNPRGKFYLAENIKQILATRNINEVLRDSGMIRGGGSQMSAKDIQEFSNHLDRYLAQNR